jgi:hypothetical protein
MPAFFLVFPVVMTIFVWFESSRTWGGSLVTVLTSFGIPSFAANQMSTKGTQLQDKLFAKWGGAATTIIMRHSDRRLDKYTKERYANKLKELVSNFVPVSKKAERDNSKDADEMYRSAASYLKEKTRDVKTYPLVFKENISYGFSRNVRAFKAVGIVIAFLSLLANAYLIWSHHIKDQNKPFMDLIHTMPFEYLGVLLVALLAFLIWAFMVTEKWVEIRAFAYARALFASCEEVSAAVGGK